MSDFAAGLSRAASKESNNHKSGRSGSETPKRSGPVLSGIKRNATMGGGINRSTKGKSGGGLK